MSKHILKDLAELQQAGIIGEETARRINVYYRQKAQGSPNRLVIIFGILGALLVGLGIILIIAHNWDDLSRPLKIFYALLPLLLGQLICVYTLIKRPASELWREAGSVFLFFAVAASISIVSQVYNIPGDFSQFLFTWMLLSIPLVYVMKSSMTSLLAICGITTYACTKSYFDYPTEIAWYYWIMLASLVPYCVHLIRSQRGNFLTFHLWFFCLSVIITLNMFNRSDSFYMIVAYVSLFSLFLMLGETSRLAERKLTGNAFLITGSLGSMSVLLFMTFRFIWKEISIEAHPLDQAFFVSMAVTLLAAAALVYSIKNRGMSAVNPKAYIFLVFILLFELGKFQPSVAQWLINVLVLMVAVLTTWRGADRDNIIILNYGLLIMAVLILCRFFDTDMSYVIRGILFLIVGFSFFGANYWFLKRRKLQNL